MTRPTIAVGAVQKALKEARDSIGKETLAFHYVNEIRLIRYAITGDCKAALDLRNLAREQQLMLRRVICLNRRLIKSHVDYQQRKQACRQLALKLQSKT
jgi:hypothetical protein